MMALHRLAQFCLVSSLHYGMSLVAKEFVASRLDQQGVLLLSRFTGSSRELVESVRFNPFAFDVLPCGHAPDRGVGSRRPETTDAVDAQSVKENNVYRCAGKILSTLLKCDLPDSTV
jgi:trehalose-6-phosphate synthase